MLFRWYLKLYHFVAAERIKQEDLDPRQIHTTLVCVLTTGILMWSYGFLAYFTIQSSVPGIIGLICSGVHLLAPLLFRISSNSYIISNVFISAGIIHQSSYSYFTGGFNSNILIWFGILPMLGGVICGKKGSITWGAISIFVALSFLYLDVTGHPFPNLISKTGIFWTQALLVFGWIFISTVCVFVYAGLRESTENLLERQGHKIDDLFRVLFHDLANPLGRVNIGLAIAKRNIPAGESNRGIEIASLAVDSMLEITQNIRRMYAVSRGKANMDLHLTSLCSSVEYIQQFFANELKNKNILLNFDAKKYHAVKLLVEPISFKNQILGNIISNAIKFSPEGGSIQISATIMAPGKISLEIIDCGIGIPSTLIKDLFDLGKKTTRPGTLGETGTGFGMHIMKSFVEMYGGLVEVESIETKGTTIRLILKGEWS